MDQTSLAYFNNISISQTEKFEEYYITMTDKNNINDCIYIVLQYFTELQIDKIYALSINKYLFFRNLPNIYLINKYFKKCNMDINAFYGIIKNENIKKEEKTDYITKILTKKKCMLYNW